MRGLRLGVMVCTGVIACTKNGDRERPATERSPYSDLEIARAEEVPTRVDTSPGPEPSRWRAPAKAARPPVPAAPASADTTLPPDTTVPPDTAVPVDTSGYVGYEPSPDPVDTGRSVDTIPAPLPPPAPDTAPRTAVVTVPAGTVIHAALEDSIHSRLDVSGRVVTAKVMQNVAAPDGRTLIPAGTPVYLTVTQVKPGRGDRKGMLELSPDSITVAGEARNLEATLQPVPYELRGRGVTGEEAAKVGVGAAGGAVVGRVLGGNTRGAVIGGVVGAAGGAVVASQTAAKDVVVKARTPLAFVLTAPMTVPR
jgi:hypothetical protein